MIDVERALRELGTRLEFPATPDLSDRVIRSISASTKPRRVRKTTIVRVGLVMATIVIVVALVPAARDRVAAWFGLRGVTIVESPFEETLTARLDLGTETSIGDAAQRAGFEPLVPAALGDPDAVFVENGRIWMLYAPGPDLPETSVPGVGAIITQFRTGDTPGFIKNVVVDGSQVVEFEGGFGIWIEGRHELVLSSRSGEAGVGRSAGSTFLWETHTLTMRLEVALSQPAAIEIASSFK